MKSLRALIAVAGTLALVLASCAPHGDSIAPGPVKALERALGMVAVEDGFPADSKMDSRKGRELAAGESAPGCFADRLTPPNLAATVKEIEKQASAGERLRTTETSWRGVISYSSASNPVVGYFSGSGAKWITDDKSLSFTGCTDPACVANRIYGKGADAEEGLLSYLWFLKTNSVLGMDTDIPIEVTSVESPSFPLRDFLFDLPELRALATVAMTLPPTMNRMEGFADVHRYPRKYYPPRWLKPGQTAPGPTATCGMASTEGRIWFVDSCMDLTYPPTGNPLDAWMYKAVLHEMGHIYDGLVLKPGGREYGRKFSDDPHWQALSGWWLDDRIENGVVVGKQWNVKPGGEGFVTDYAGTTPVEDFADTVSHYRFAPDVFGAKNLPGKAAYVREKVFAGRSYTAQGVIEQAATKAEEQVRRLAPDFVPKCLAQPLNTLASVGITPDAENRIPTSPVSLELEVPLDENEQACLDYSVAWVIDREIARQKLIELEGCRLLDAAAVSAIGRTVAANVAQEFSALLEKSEEVAKIAAASKKFRELTAERLDPREAYRKCMEDESPRDCYGRTIDSVLSAVADEGGFRNTLGGSLLEGEFKSFHEGWPFEKAEAEFKGIWAKIMDAQRGQHVRAAGHKWEKCIAGDYPDVDPSVEGSGEAPLLSPFDGGSLYVDARLLDCLNSGADREMGAIRDRFFSEVMGLQGSTDEITTRFLAANYLNPLWSGTWRDAMVEARAREQETLSELGRSVVPTLRKKLVSDLSWVSAASPMEACLKAGAGWLDDGTVVPPAAMPVVFQTREDTRRLWSVGACLNIEQVPEVRARLQTIAAEQARIAQERWKLALAKMEELVLAEAAVRAGECLRLYPGSYPSYQRGRSECLVAPWNTYVARGLEKWKASGLDPEIIARSEEARIWTSSTRRSTLQRMALDAMEARRGR